MKKHWGLMFLSLLVLSACDVPGPEQRRQAMHLPPPGFKGDAVKGEAAFQQYCTTCHGSRGQGPPLIHKIYRPAHHADLSFHMAAGDGVKQHHWQFGDMPSQPDVTPEEMAHIISYIRREQQRADIK
jgi:mono/diheme cytochrome c family protein